MSDLGDVIFGGGGKTQSGATSGDIEKSINFIRETTGRAREDIFNLVPEAARSRLKGAKGALDIFKQSIPEQLRTFGLGNLGAQETTSAGLPQQIRALLGQNVDLGRIGPRPIRPDLDFVSGASLPEFEVPTKPEPAEFDIQSILNRFGGF